jgi:hypothetical protein
MQMMQIEPLTPDVWPTTVEDAVGDVLSLMPDAEKTRLRSIRKEQLMLEHFGWGLVIRNRHGLLRGNDKLMLAVCRYPWGDADDASMKILDAVWHELRK